MCCASLKAEAGAGSCRRNGLNGCIWERVCCARKVGCKVHKGKRVHRLPERSTGENAGAACERRASDGISVHHV